ncbi:MAG: DUF1246 domain-containing protein, partial [Nitrososphaerota archaeon]
MSDVVSSYDPDRLAVATLASHTALQILRAAHRYGFHTVALSHGDVARFYSRFSFIDEVWPVSPTSLGVVDSKLVERNAILIPHGSLVEYFGIMVKSLKTPIFGNRHLVDWESDQELKMKLLREANIPTPKTFQSSSEAKVPAIVKLYGAKGGRGYFVARSREELALRCAGLAEPYIVQEYVVGVPAYYH